MTEGPDIPFEEAKPRRCQLCGLELRFYRYTGNAMEWKCPVCDYKVGVLL